MTTPINDGGPADEKCIVCGMELKFHGESCLHSGELRYGPPYGLPHEREEEEAERLSIVMAYEAMRLCLGLPTKYHKPSEVVRWIGAIAPTSKPTPPPFDEAKERERFERVMHAAGLDTIRNPQDPTKSCWPGQYCNSSTESAWQAWCAAKGQP